MFSKRVSTAFLAAAIAVTPAMRASADAGDFVAGAIIGGIVGHAATKQAQRNRASKVYRPTVPSTVEGRQIQTSLNYFGFNAGGVDGQLGRRSQEAIMRYQVYMGYPATGNLTPFEQSLLVDSYNRAMAGGYQVSQQMATHPDGPRGLIKTYRTELAGAPAQPQQTQPMTTMASTGGALPNFGMAASPRSLSAHCDSVSLVTSSQGGYTTVSNMTDPNVVLNEQFCLARIYAVAKSEDRIAGMQGVTSDQIAQQCQAFGPAMKAYVDNLGFKPMAALVQDVRGFIPSTGMTPAQLSLTAEVCLGVGYRTDNMEVALGSALLLVATGQTPYAELMGHHLMQGFGPQQRPDLAQPWYQAAISSLSSGSPAVFNPGQPERVVLLQSAVNQANGGAASMQAQPAGGLPMFKIQQ